VLPQVVHLPNRVAPAAAGTFPRSDDPVRCKILCENGKTFDAVDSPLVHSGQPIGWRLAEQGSLRSPTEPPVRMQQIATNWQPPMQRSRDCDAHPDVRYRGACQTVGLAVARQLPVPARVSSTRRFCARPAAVSLEATGSASPYPRTATRLGLTPCASRKSATFWARIWESC
jgi:hypothetical protein